MTEQLQRPESWKFPESQNDWTAETIEKTGTTGLIPAPI
jgi:hypothetical protein